MGKRLVSLVLIIVLIASLAVPAVATSENWTCTKCGASNNGAFCGSCGAFKPAGATNEVDNQRELYIERSEEWMCLKCGNISSSAFCTACGNRRNGLRGSFVYYGAYEQDGNTANGAEPIEWIVTYYSDYHNTITLVSRYILEAQELSGSKTFDSWFSREFSSLAFNTLENNQIKLDSVKNKGIDVLTANPTAYAKSKKADNSTKYIQITMDVDYRELFYSSATKLMASGDYVQGLEFFELLQGYSDSRERIQNYYDTLHESQYELAGDYMSQGNYVDAYILYSKLIGYKDSASLITSNTDLLSVTSEARERMFGTPGSIVTFGAYEQDNNENNGKEPIEWLVLDVQGSKAFLVSRYVLDFCRYGDGYSTSTTWSNSNVREWLNNEFMNAAFTAGEQKAILLSKVDNSDSVDSSNRSVPDTEDQIFLLSKSEVNRFFYGTHERKGIGTEAAKAASGYWARMWYMRSTSYWEYYRATNACMIDDEGDFNTLRSDDSSCVGMRPAFWIDLNADIY